MVLILTYYTANKTMNIHSYFPQSVHKDIFSKLSLNNPLVISGISNSTAKSYLIGSLLQEKKFKNIFWITNNNKEIYEIRNNITFWSDRPVILMNNIILGDAEDYKVTEAITSIHSDKNKFYLINSKDFNVPMPTFQEIKEGGVLVEKDQSIRTVEFFNKLINMGYQPSMDVT